VSVIADFDDCLKAGFSLIRSTSNVVDFLSTAFGITAMRQNSTWKEIVGAAVLVFFVAYGVARVLKVIALEKVFDAIIPVLGVLLYTALISLPAIGITYLTWKLSRNMRPIVAQAIFRAGVFAIAITPSVWGHAGIVPAIILAFVLHGRDRLDVVLEIVMVWAIALAVLLVRARNRKNAAISVN
jgi:hypothetical protein